MIVTNVLCDRLVTTTPKKHKPLRFLQPCNFNTKAAKEILTSWCFGKSSCIVVNSLHSSIKNQSRVTESDLQKRRILKETPGAQWYLSFDEKKKRNGRLIVHKERMNRRSNEKRSRQEKFSMLSGLILNTRIFPKKKVFKSFESNLTTFKHSLQSEQ